MDKSFNKIYENIEEYNLINVSDNILIGLSGGPDSVFLFHGLRLLKDKMEFNLYAAHINHLYRGEDADRDEEFVRKLCEKYDVKLFVKRQNASILAKKEKITEEEAGRIIRYGFFNKILEEIGEGLIATAHNKDDQGETLIQRIIRGTGIEGLTGMDYKQDNVIRPILNIEKKDIVGTLDSLKLEYCIDKTNEEPIYGRNKIRLELIPYIEEKFNKNLKDTLFRMSENMKDDYKIIEEAVDRQFKKALILKNDEIIELDIENLLTNSKGLRNRILRNSIEIVKGNKVDVERKHIDYLDDFITKNETGKTIDLGDKIIGEVSYGKIIIRNKKKFKNYEYNLNKGINYIEELNIKIVVEDDIEGIITTTNNNILIDKDKIKGNLKVRNRKSGDKFQPLGMKGRKKVKDYFIDEKIPKEKRKKIPIISDDDNIIWIGGYRMNNKYRITEETKNKTRIEIVEV